MRRSIQAQDSSSDFHLCPMKHSNNHCRCFLSYGQREMVPEGSSSVTFLGEANFGELSYFLEGFPLLSIEVTQASPTAMLQQNAYIEQIQAVRPESREHFCLQVHFQSSAFNTSTLCMGNAKCPWSCMSVWSCFMSTLPHLWATMDQDIQHLKAQKSRRIMAVLAGKGTRISPSPTSPLSQDYCQYWSTSATSYALKASGVLILQLSWVLCFSTTPLQAKHLILTCKTDKERLTHPDVQTSIWRLA